MYIKVYFILAHKNPSQIKDLISLLEDNKSLFFIHLDKKVNQNEYKSLIDNSSCHFVKNRVSCTWGKYSLVQASLNGMKEVQNFINTNFKSAKYHFIMLSGEDLPLKKNDFIHDFLKTKTETSFLNYWKLPYSKWWGGGLFRFENLYFFQYKKYSKLNYWINRIIKKIGLKFLLPLNRFMQQFPDFNIYGASQWMILNEDMVAFVLEKSNDNHKFNSIFKYVLAPDELYFSTLILNFDVLKQFPVDNIKTHLVNFNGVDASPKYLEIEDLDFNKEDFLFARKFDPNVNHKTIARVIKELGR
ncbi:beta-1,6-N-acetylglucosaminyltransferase [Flavobacterium sp. KMS]|uniref:beta-1,6-N-acetylglucosaminyltransferase n=1 Tax=unclassified Flavobacterium TaxID=196869 RepID=UPI00057F6FC8|nr:beta-1,6-N-acetylglucosaminyltransferase [Flavobacterium sp. KMS]KIA99812.1 hypothetical protein OA93_03055 [Flavobacterium sp. KMS]